ncbi:putative transposon-encoded protein with retrovirus polyprotein and reverse transcriptase domain [Klebsormidium nitens]|uniref:Putative transposon-encoded protein with retrovirus polyprotein and reverse transcriptase domain n=1 Tax=Klebsormidium nitens TaxID=105231 RepID=A0A1Y1IK18_KLENI|nr:putative transposon-encoded protein with retrovirus polyprotein and reverse transcriptase domain [Klebsormidium nitens]|eukprot:GAQ91134.1 putative transposon-encoded protein with retrovirus polyprotein and reverse transcriptase domain [Klebsormidium nitens]
MPVADELFDDLGGSDCFSTLDLRMGYHQIRIREGDQWKLAFWGHDDIYMPLRTPFGPKNAPALFQRLMDRVLRQLREVARAFIDDTIVHSRGFEEHLEALRAVFEQLRKYNIKVHPKKIRILFPEIPFLGHLVNPVGLKPQELKPRKYNIKVHPKKIRILFPEIPFLGNLVNPVGLKPQELKVAAIQRIPYPTSVTALKQLLGIINYYRRFLKGCSVVARPLNNLLKKDVEFPAELPAECKAGTDQLKAGLCAAPLLVYLYGVHFKLYTDHRPLEWLMTSQNLTGMHARWALMLQEFDFEVKYRKGLVNMNADRLSRNPLPETEDRRERGCMTTRRQSRCGRRPRCLRGKPGRRGRRWTTTKTSLGGGRSGEKSIPTTPQVVRGEQPDPAWSEKEQERVRRRSLSYRFDDGVLLRRLGNGEEKVVPPPAEREGVVQAVHEETGHWGEKRTVHLLKRTYWWAGMYETARRGVAGCHQCDRTKAAFAKEMSVMQSLPIMGLGYRWSLDFAGPLITIRTSSSVYRVCGSIPQRRKRSVSVP